MKWNPSSSSNFAFFPSGTFCLHSIMRFRIPMNSMRLYHNRKVFNFPFSPSTTNFIHFLFKLEIRIIKSNRLFYFKNFLTMTKQLANMKSNARLRGKLISNLQMQIFSRGNESNRILHSMFLPHLIELFAGVQRFLSMLLLLFSRLIVCHLSS